MNRLSLLWTLAATWLLLLLVTLSSTPAAAREPTQIIEMPQVLGGTVLDVAISQTEPDRLFALLAHPEGSQLYGSTDGAESWSSLYTFARPVAEPNAPSRSAYPGEAVAVDPADAQTLYAGTAQTLRRSLDGGLTWREVLTTGLYIETPAPSVVYAVGPTGKRQPGCGVTGWVWGRSDDAGTTWIITPLPCTLRVSALAVDPNDFNNVYVSIRAPNNSNPLLHSADGGLTWQHTDSTFLEPFGAVGLAIDPTDSARLYAITYDKVLVSTDSGGTWDQTSEPDALKVTQFQSVVVTAQGHVLVAEWEPIDQRKQTRIYLSMDHGASWWLSTLPLDGYITALTLSPSEPHTFYASMLGKGILKSRTLGASWQRHNHQLFSQSEASQIAVAQQGGVLYAASRQDNGGLWRTSNAGADWLHDIQNMSVHDFSIHPSGQIGLAATETGLYELNESTDSQWRQTSFPGFTEPLDKIYSVAVSPVDENARLFAGYRALTTEPIIQGVIGRWTGKAWSLTPVTNSGFPRLVAHPTDPNRWYGFLSSSGIMVSTDGGQAWILRRVPRSDPTDSPPTLQSMAVTPKGIYLYGFETLLFSADEGQTWAELPVPPSGLDREQFNTNFTGAIFAGPANSLLVSNQDGVWILYDGEKEWQPLALQGLTVLGLAASDNILYANTGWQIYELNLPVTTQQLMLPIVSR